MHEVGDKAGSKTYDCGLRIFWFIRAAFTAIFSFCLLAGTGEAQVVCSIDQVTDETSGRSDLPSINSDGTRIAFDSDADINGGNPEGNYEIFLFNTNTMSIMQLSVGVGSG